MKLKIIKNLPGAVTSRAPVVVVGLKWWWPYDCGGNIWRMAVVVAVEETVEVVMVVAVQSLWVAIRVLLYHLIQFVTPCDV